MQRNLQYQFWAIQLMASSLASILGIGFWLYCSEFGLTQPLYQSSVTPVTIAQAIRRIQVADIGSQIYEQLPNLPSENRYISQETGEVAENDTFVGRFIRYHLYIKGRSPLSRFDWKLTVADYLGANEVMFENRYPSGNALNTNPMVSDRQAMNNLTRAERNALVNTIVRLLNPNLPVNSSPQPTTNSSEPSPAQSSPRTTPLPPQPQPGDADLLKLN